MSPPGETLIKIAWFVGLWAAGVGTVMVVGLIIKLWLGA